MKKIYLLSTCLLAFGLTACVNSNNEPYMASSELSAAAEKTVVTESTAETEILPPCDSNDTDCVLSNDFLTESFATSPENEALSLSRPAAKGAISVKDKQIKTVTDQKTSESISSTQTDPAIVLTKEVKTEETAVSKEDPELPMDLVVPPEKIADTPAEKTEVMSEDKVEKIAQEAISASERVVPLKKVKTTITETTTRVQEQTPASTKAGRGLIDRIHYGEEIHDWDASSGRTLRSLLTEWGDKSGWTVIWKLDRDYHLEAGVVFRGTYTDVSAAIIRSFARATPAPIGTFYQGNRVLLISTQEDENAR